MESLDRTIVLALAKDSSLSLSDFAAKLDVPSSTLHQRVKKLEAKGIITGYRAEVDKREVGLKINALVSLTPIDPAAPDDVVEKISAIQEESLFCEYFGLIAKLNGYANCLIFHNRYFLLQN